MSSRSRQGTGRAGRAPRPRNASRSGTGAGKALALDLALIAERIAELRAERQMSVEAFADWIGVESHSTVSDWLNRKRPPSATHLALLSDRCGVTTDWLLGRSDRKYPDQWRTDTKLEHDLAAAVARRASVNADAKDRAWAARLSVPGLVNAREIIDAASRAQAEYLQLYQARVRDAAKAQQRDRMILAAIKATPREERDASLRLRAGEWLKLPLHVQAVLQLIGQGYTFGLPYRYDANERVMFLDMQEAGLPLPEVRVQLPGAPKTLPIPRPDASVGAGTATPP